MRGEAAEVPQTPQAGMQVGASLSGPALVFRDQFLVWVLIFISHLLASPSIFPSTCVVLFFVFCNTTYFFLLSKVMLIHCKKLRKTFKYRKDENK